MKELGNAAKADSPESGFAKISLAEQIANREPESEAGFRPLLKFLREGVTPEGLLSDRIAQANLEVIIKSYRGDKDLGNPFPRIKFLHPRGGMGIKYGTFMLKGDNDHLYYYDEMHGSAYTINKETGKQEVVVPDYLRPQDVVSPEDYSEDKYPRHQIDINTHFTHTLEKVDINGGKPQRYNYNSQQWEEYGEDIGEQIILPDLNDALKILSQDGSTLQSRGDALVKARKLKIDVQNFLQEREDRRRTFVLNIKGQEITFRTFDIEKREMDSLANFLEALSRGSNLLKIRPDKGTHPESFWVKGVGGNAEALSTKPNEVFGNFVEEIGEKRDDTPSFFLGAFSHPVINNLYFRLIAIPVKSLPKDTAVSANVRREKGSAFEDLHQMYGACFADLKTTGRELSPTGFRNGRYLMISVQDLIPLLVQENPIQTVRITGVSKKDKKLFYKDVDVSQVPVIHLRSADNDRTGQIGESGERKLPSSSRPLLGE